MTDLLLKHYLENHSAISLSKIIGKSTQIISYWRNDAAANTFIRYDVKTGKVYRVWSETIKNHYERTL